MENVQSSVSVPEGPKRPILLTVLCILTFIGSGWGIVSNINKYMNADITSQVAGNILDSAKEQISKESGNNGTSNKMAEQVLTGASRMLDPANKKKNAMYTILANLLTLGGAFLMFQMKKPGFWVYIAGTGVAILTPLLVYGAANLMSIGLTAVIGFFGILFAVLYSLNLKYMK